MQGEAKEIVIRVGGSHGFVLPETNELAVLPPTEESPGAHVRLSIPGAAGESFVLRQVVEDDEEIVYHLEPLGIQSGVGNQPIGCPWQDMLNREQERLHRELVTLGAPVNADAWAPGESHEEHFARVRALVRQVRRERDAVG